MFVYIYIDYGLLQGSDQKFVRIKKQYALSIYIGNSCTTIRLIQVSYTDLVKSYINRDGPKVSVACINKQNICLFYI